VTGPHIVVAPTRLPGRDAQRQPTAWPNTVAPVAQCAQVVFYVLEHLKGANEIEGTFDVCRRAGDDLAATNASKALTDDACRLRIDLNTDVVVVSSKTCGNGADTRTDLENGPSPENPKPPTDYLVPQPAANSERGEHGLRW
jgi:hypothetical protein